MTCKRPIFLDKKNVNIFNFACKRPLKNMLIFSICLINDNSLDKKHGNVFNLASKRGCVW